MHWAVHGQTAAEIIVQRANADKPNMGLTSWKGKRITPADTNVAKNYLVKDELEILNPAILEPHVIKSILLHLKLHDKPPGLAPARIRHTTVERLSCGVPEQFQFN